MQHIDPVLGWSLNYIAALDVHSPGVAGTFLHAGAERRQVIAAFLSSKPLPVSPRQAVEVAEFVSGANHREILSAAFGTVPCGLRGALARAGSQPHPRRFYRVLHEVLSDPELRAAAAVIRQLDWIGPHRVLVAQRLPPDICSPNLVAVISYPRTARDVANLLSLFSSNGIDRTALVGALRSVTSAKQLPEFWDRWSHKLTFPPHPVPMTEHHVPIANGFELRRIALRYRNCVRHYLTKIMEKEAAFSEAHWAGEDAVIHLKRREAIWTLEGIFGKGNDEVSPALRCALEDHLQEAGVVISPTWKNSEGEWSVLSRLSGRLMYNF